MMPNFVAIKNKTVELEAGSVIRINPGFLGLSTINDKSLYDLDFPYDDIETYGITFGLDSFTLHIEGYIEKENRLARDSIDCG